MRRGVDPRRFALLTGTAAKDRLGAMVQSAIAMPREQAREYDAMLRALGAQPPPDGRFRYYWLSSAEWGLNQSPLQAPTVFNFFDPTYGSCSKLIADIGKSKYGVDFEAHADLIAWADRIDTASFASAATRFSAWSSATAARSSSRSRGPAATSSGT